MRRQLFHIVLMLGWIRSDKYHSTGALAILKKEKGEKGKNAMVELNEINNIM